MTEKTTESMEEFLSNVSDLIKEKALPALLIAEMTSEHDVFFSYNIEDKKQGTYLIHLMMQQLAKNFGGSVQDIAQEICEKELVFTFNRMKKLNDWIDETNSKRRF